MKPFLLFAFCFLLCCKAMGQGCDPFGSGLADLSLTNGVTIQLAPSSTATNSMHFDCRVYTNAVYEGQYALSLNGPWHTLTGRQTFTYNTWWVFDIECFPCAPSIFYRVQSAPR